MAVSVTLHCRCLWLKLIAGCQWILTQARTSIYSNYRNYVIFRSLPQCSKGLETTKCFILTGCSIQVETHVRYWLYLTTLVLFFSNFKQFPCCLAEANMLCPGPAIVSISSCCGAENYFQSWQPQNQTLQWWQLWQGAVTAGFFFSFLFFPPFLYQLRENFTLHLTFSQWLSVSLECTKLFNNKQNLI